MAESPAWPGDPRKHHMWWPAHDAATEAGFQPLEAGQFADWYVRERWTENLHTAMADYLSAGRVEH